MAIWILQRTSAFEQLQIWANYNNIQDLTASQILHFIV